MSAQLEALVCPNINQIHKKMTKLHLIIVKNSEKSIIWHLRSRSFTNECQG